MFNACVKGETCKTTDMLTDLSCKMENLENVIQVKLEFLISCFCTPTYQYPISEYVTELDQGDKVLSYLNPYATEFQPGDKQCSASGDLDDVLIDEIFCKDREYSSLLATLPKSSERISKLLLWQPGEKTIFMKPPLQDELLSEAVTTIQRWFRRIFYTEVESLDDNDLVSSVSSDDDNSAEAVAIRRAFICSTASTNPGIAAPENVDNWTNTEMLTWISDTLDGIMDEDDRLSSVKAFWRKWEKANSHFPKHMQTRIVKSIDERLHDRGFPLLRELLDMI